LGAFADRRPYFTMKLVRGQTLSSLLAERPAPAHDLPRFLSIFEAICQTVAYSHARGVIHRDLKPSNVMVGSFGEVQVMDWGLAKVLKAGDAADQSPAQPAPAESPVATVRSGSDADDSRAGSVLGTPAYMAPEQASGALERVDRRSDVFGLGSILCEILTGHTAYAGRSVQEVVRKAMRGDTAEALTRLDGSGAEVELIALAKDCLAVEPDNRPRDAGLVAQRITAFLTGVQERVHAAERERAVAVAKATEERRRRKVQLALAASLLALTSLGGLSTTYYLQHEQARAAAGQRVVDQVTTLHGQALGHPEETPRWEIALAAVEQADPAGDPRTKAKLVALQKQIQDGLDRARRDKALLDRLVDIRSGEYDEDHDGSDADAAYAGAFRQAGIDLANLSPAEAGARIKARPPSVMLALAAALDDWAMRRRNRAGAAGAAQLSVASRIADPDPWRTELRIALDETETGARLTALQALAKKANLAELGPISLHLLGTGLSTAGDRALAETVLRRAQERHPRDVWINFELAGVLEKLSRRDEAIRFYTAARALRPETAHMLAHALEVSGKGEEAIGVFRDLERLQPDVGQHLECLGKSLQSQGRAAEARDVLARAEAALRARIELHPDDAKAHTGLGNSLRAQGKLEEAILEYRAVIKLWPGHSHAYSNLGHALVGHGKLEAAIAAFREATRLQPDDAEAHCNLGKALYDHGKLDDAITQWRAAIRLKPDLATAHFNLGDALRDQGKLDEAIAEVREVIRLKPDDAEAHNSLGIALARQGKADAAIIEFREKIRLKPDHAGARYNLGLALKQQGKVDEAIAEFRTAIRLSPEYATAHHKLANTLKDQGKLDESIAEYRTAIRLSPEFAAAHYELGNTLKDHGKLDEAIAEFRAAIRLSPEIAAAHYDLGNTLKDQGKLDQAITEYRIAIRLQPDHAEAHCNLGIFLQQRGANAEGLAMLRKGHELGSRRPGWQYPSAQWVADAERALAAAQTKTATARAQRLVVGDQAPKLDVKSFDKGEPIATLEHGKFYVVEFWATWCGPCRVSIPHLTELQKKHPDVAFIGVSVWEHDQNAVKPFIDTMGDQMAYRVAVDAIPENADASDGIMATNWMKAAGQGGIPTAFIIDKGGRIAWIGHPMSMDEPLKNIVGGSWDLAAAKAKSRKESENRGAIGLEAAVAQLRNEIRLKPNDGGLYSNYGRHLGYLGRHDEAIEACRKAIKLNPSDGGAHYNLGNSLAAQGRLRDALAAFGEAQRVEPSLCQSRHWQVRYHAACAAARAAALKGKDEPPPDDAEKVKLRTQALDWLKAEHKAWEALLEAGTPGARTSIAQALRHWKQQSDLAGIRDDEALARLPQAERKAWQALWADVDSLLNRSTTQKKAADKQPIGTAPLRQDAAPAQRTPSAPRQGTPALLHDPVFPADPFANTH
jgi:serine/threonine-protein kinase